MHVNILVTLPGFDDPGHSLASEYHECNGEICQQLRGRSRSRLSSLTVTFDGFWAKPTGMVERIYRHLSNRTAPSPSYGTNRTTENTFTQELSRNA